MHGLKGVCRFYPRVRNISFLHTKAGQKLIKHREMLEPVSVTCILISIFYLLVAKQEKGGSDSYDKSKAPRLGQPRPYCVNIERETCVRQYDHGITCAHFS